MALCGEGAGPAMETDLERDAKVTKVQSAMRGRMVRKSLMAADVYTDEQKEALKKAQLHSEARRNFYKDVHEYLGVSKSVYNSCESLQKAHAYLEERQIPRLLEGLLAQAALARPDDLRGYLFGLIQEMQQRNGSPDMGCFTPEDLETMFNMKDPERTGAVPAARLVEVLRELGCCPGKEEELVENEVDSMDEEVDKETFVRVLRVEMENMFSSSAYSGKS
mmetsp:Transcript_36976/g.105170  ORF Transcript_36976/g.105170 Transcript_36976/m.105170 type:complete len:221 (-) Transcript_36976:92-754(-)